MATSETIRIQAQLMSSLQIDKATGLNWIKDQVENIASDHFLAAKYVQEKFSTSASYETYIPGRKIVLIDKVLTDQRIITSRYDFHGKELTMFEPGEYILMYYSIPDLPATRDEEIDLPIPYANALKFYVAARIRARLTGQNDPNAVSFYEEYTNAIKEADNAMNQMRRRYKRMPPARRGI